jgi:hypothetical protein
LPGVPDFAGGWVRIGVEVVGDVWVFAAAPGPAAPADWLPAVLVPVLGEGAAPAMPAAAPPVATAPATIVAPSSFEIFTVEPPGLACLAIHSGRGC